MEFTLTKQSALSVIRWLRADPKRAGILRRRCNIIAPDAAPLKRWSKNSVSLACGQFPDHVCTLPLHLAVPEPRLRVRTAGVESTVYGDGVPDGAFIDLGNGMAASGPELLFAELAASLHPVQSLVLAHELCGSFSRDAIDPYNGPITYGVAPLTSVERIGQFLQRARRFAGAPFARGLLPYLNDNAWSPTESVIAAFLRLPIDSLGYGFGELVLNPRAENTVALPGARGSRVPDIVIAGTPHGINYDGLVHLDLDSIAEAGIELGAHPESRVPAEALDAAIAKVRAKAVDDIRRNRELAAGGMDIIPVVKEDLYTPDGLDQIALLLMEALERDGAPSMLERKRKLQRKRIAAARYKMLLSLLPGNHERDVQVGHFLGGAPVVECDDFFECWIEI